MARRILVGGMAAAALALGLLAGCGDEGTSGTGAGTSAEADPPATSEPSTSGAPGEGTEGGAASALRGEIEKLLKESPVEFKPQNAELTDKAKATLKKIAEAAAGDESAKLSITATAGWKDADKAKKLSQERVDALIKELTAHGVAEERLDGDALGNEGVLDDPDAAMTAQVSVVGS